MGLLPFMDSECSRGAAANDSGLVAKWHKAYKDHPNYAVCGPDTPYRRPDGSFTEREDFLIRHYAGSVIYTCQGFVEKNRDAFLDHVSDVISESESPLMQALFPPRESSQTNTVRTVAARFMQDMGVLVETLAQMESRFVRCVKTNDRFQPALLDKQRVLQQLVCSGVIAALEVRRAGFPTRVVYEEFVKRFRALNPGSAHDPAAFREHRLPEQIAEAMGSRGSRGGELSVRELTARMMTHPTVVQRVRGEQYRLGVGKLFMQADVLQVLERIRDSMLEPLVRRIQRWWISSRVNWVQHALSRILNRIADAINRAHMQRVHRDHDVHIALEDAASAGRGAKSVSMFSNPEMMRGALATLTAKADNAWQCVELAIERKNQAARDRAQMLEMLDSGLARLRAVEQAVPLLQSLPRAPSLQSAVARGNRSMEDCRQVLFRAASQDLVDPEATMQQTAARGASSVLKRSFTKAVLVVMNEPAADGFDLDAGIDAHRERVHTALTQVDEAELLCQEMMRERQRLDEARAAWTAELESTQRVMQQAHERAETAGVMGVGVVQHAFAEVRETRERAQAVLATIRAEDFEDAVQRALRAVAEAADIVEREATFKELETARNRANLQLAAAQKKFREASANAETWGVTDRPSFARAFASAEDALSQASTLDQSDVAQFTVSVQLATQRVEALTETAQQEKAHKDRLDHEKAEELRKLQPAHESLAALRAKLDYTITDATAGSAARSAVEEAEAALRVAVDAVRSAESLAQARPAVTEALTKVQAAERVVIDEKQRLDAVTREVARATKILGGLQRRVEDTQHAAEALGMVVAELIASCLATAEAATADAFRGVRRAENVAVVRRLLTEAVEAVEQAEQDFVRARARYVDAERQRTLDVTRSSELRRTYTDVADIAKSSNIVDLPAARAALLAAENALTQLDSRLAKPINLAWLQHDGQATDRALQQDAETKVEEAETCILMERRRFDTESREARSNHSGLEFVTERLAALQAQAAGAGLDSHVEVSAALTAARAAVEAARTSITESRNGTAAVGRANVQLAVSALDHAEGALQRARVSKEGLDKDKSQSQIVLDACLTKLQAVVATVDASGPQVASLCDHEIDAATEALNLATRLLRRGEDVSTLASAVESAVRAVDAADEAATRGRQRVTDVRRLRQQAHQRVEALAETFEVLCEKATTTGVRHAPGVSSAIAAAEQMLGLLRSRASGSLEDFLRDSATVQRMVVDTSQRVQEAEEAVDAEAAKRERVEKERATGRLDFERWLVRHARCVQLAEQYGINDVAAVQTALSQAEKEIETAGPALRAGNMARVAVLATKVQTEEDVVAAERQKKERRQLEIQRVRKELPALQRRLTVLATAVEAAGPLVAVLVDSEMADAQRAMRTLETYLEYGGGLLSSGSGSSGGSGSSSGGSGGSSSGSMIDGALQPALDEAVERVSRAEESVSRQTQRVRKARSEKQHELAKLSTVEARFREIGREVARFCARSDHLRMQLGADWSDVCWWGSQAKHSRMAEGSGPAGAGGKAGAVGGVFFGRGEVRPVPAVTMLAEAMAAAESSITNARRRVDVALEEWLSVGPTAAHTAVEEAQARVEQTARVVEGEMDKLASEERERRAVSSALETHMERLAGAVAMARLTGVSDNPRVADALREADHAIQVVGQVLSSGNVAAANPALKVAERAVSDASEAVVVESQRRDRVDAERAAATEEVATAKKHVVEAFELARLLELLDSPLVAENISYAQKAVQAAELVLQGDFAPAVVSREAAAATRASEEAARATQMERGRREQLARLKSQREIYARQTQQRKAQEAFRRQEEEMRQRRLLQDQLEEAVHRLTTQWPQLEGARGAAVAAESSIDAARQKLARGTIGAAHDAVRSAVDRVNDAAYSADVASKMAGVLDRQAQQAGRMPLPVAAAAAAATAAAAPDEAGAAAGAAAPSASTRRSRVRGGRQSDLSALTDSSGEVVRFRDTLQQQQQQQQRQQRQQQRRRAGDSDEDEDDEENGRLDDLEAITTNIHFLSRGLVDLNSSLQRQSQILALQTGLLTGVGNREQMVDELQRIVGPSTSL
jgi:hypothetical protein